MADHPNASPAIDALTMTIDQRKAAGADLDGLLHHSDRGVQYASGPYQATPEAAGAVTSMSRKGNCHDNAVAERFFGSLKAEWTEHERYRSREQAGQSIFEYVDVF